MPFAELANLPVYFALVVFRLAGLMVLAPLLGSDQLPKQIKLFLALAMALALCASVDQMPRPEALPESPWLLAVGIGGEIIFGVFTGLLMSLVFIAARWAGGLAGQQMGFNMAGNFGGGSDFGDNPLGDAYFILTLLLFLQMNGHHQMVLGIGQSFETLPPLAVTFNTDSLTLLTDALVASVALAMRIAAPICVAMLIVDLSLGMLGKTIPALNLLSVGLSIRAMVGLVVVIVGLALTGFLLTSAITDGLTLAEMLWNGN